MTARPVLVVLVHGGFLGPWSWAGVVTALERRGLMTVVPDLPSVGDPGQAPLGDFYADAEEVRRVLDSLSGPVLLCGHSYGGAVITEAAAGPHPSVAHLVYLAGAVPDVNESMVSFAPVDGGEVPEAPDRNNAASEGPVAGPAGTIVLPAEQGVAVLFHDCSSEHAREGAELLRPMNPAVGAQPTTGAAWRDIPTTFVRCTKDRLPEIVTAAFFQHGPEVVELSAGHCPNWSQPEAVAELLAVRVERLAWT
ncbi:MAG: alpha/beta fold hydrolase [Pseudonocardiaceae bacterium]